MPDIVTNICEAIVKRGSHGGKRAGAGRPKVAPEAKKADPLRSIRIPDTEWESIKAAAASRGQSASELIRTAALAAAEKGRREYS